MTSLVESSVNCKQYLCLRLKEAVDIVLMKILALMSKCQNKEISGECNIENNCFQTGFMTVAICFLNVLKYDSCTIKVILCS